MHGLMHALCIPFAQLLHARFATLCSHKVDISNSLSLSLCLSFSEHFPSIFRAFSSLSANIFQTFCTTQSKTNKAITLILHPHHTPTKPPHTWEIQLLFINKLIVV